MKISAPSFQFRTIGPDLPTNTHSPLFGTNTARSTERPDLVQGNEPLVDPPACLTFEQLSKRYGSVQALNEIDLSVPHKSVLALLGPNGAGKSTLFGCLLGTVRPDNGKILFAGKPIQDAHRLNFGYVSERVALYAHRTVSENGAFFACLRGHTIADFEAQLRRVGLHTARDRKVRQLSKGMLQRLGLALALCGRPQVLVLDEPFNGLDPALLDGLQGILKEENERGATLLISTHTMSAVEPLATHVAILLQGKLAATGTLPSLKARFAEASLEIVYHNIARQDRSHLEQTTSDL